MKKKFIASALLLAVVSFTSNTAVFAAPGHQGPAPDKGRVERTVNKASAPQKHNTHVSNHNPQPHRSQLHRAQPHHAQPHHPAPHNDIHVHNDYYYGGHYDNCGTGVGVAATILGVLALGTGIVALATN